MLRNILIGIVIIAFFMYFTNMDTSQEEQELNQEVKTITLYHVPWCGFCQQFKPVFEQFRNQAQVQYPNIIVTAIDCQENKDICPSDLRGYPAVEAHNKSTGKKERLMGMQEIDKLHQVASSL
tara:strand:+ start:10981 stop:11349 length:369 start_codon:yes stop_codon:yes gene_type:complete